MIPRSQRPNSGAAPAVSRSHVAPVHRGPQALNHDAFPHAPNAALLIDFDNVTMGIRSDLASELRQLLASDIIKGKVAVQRAYADWRRYPQYVVPLAESSIDMIMAPAYGSSKKNATDIRLAVDAIELVFTRPEIGTFILLSGDSDFASMVTKLKEYGKYVIGVGIRESSSDLLVMNCDEYYSYNALAGLVKTADEEVVRKDPWELVVEAMRRMVQQNDVMRSDRLKQVMQDMDPGFDEKDYGFSKFSRFCQEASSRGLITLARMENGQYEVGAVGPSAESGAAPAAGAGSARRDSRAPEEAAGDVAEAAPAREAAATTRAGSEEREERGRRRRRPRRGGRGSSAADRAADSATGAIEPATSAAEPDEEAADEEVVTAAAAPAAAETAPEVIGRSGERLTRAEAFDLVRRATEALVGDSGNAAHSKQVRIRAFELLGRDSESLSERNFPRILKDAHDQQIVDLRRRGDDHDVSIPATTSPIAGQINQAVAARTAAPADAPAPVGGLTSRGIGGRGRGRSRSSAPPPDLLAVGVVDDDSTSTVAPADDVAGEQEATAAPAKRPAKKTAARKGARKSAAKKAATRKTAKTARKSNARKASAASKSAAKTANAASEGGAESPAESAAKAPARKASRSVARKRASASKSSASRTAKSASDSSTPAGEEQKAAPRKAARKRARKSTAQ